MKAEDLPTKIFRRNRRERIRLTSLESVHNENLEYETGKVWQCIEFCEKSLFKPYDFILKLLCCSSYVIIAQRKKDSISLRSFKYIKTLIIKLSILLADLFNSFIRMPNFNSWQRITSNYIINVCEYVINLIKSMSMRSQKLNWPCWLPTFIVEIAK